MKNFKDKEKRGGGFRGADAGGFKKKSWGGAGGGEKAMFNATCSECRKNCEVPFKPFAGKAVYCRDCFGDRDPKPKKEYDDKPSYRQDSRSLFRPTTDDTKKQLVEINAKLDQILRALQNEEPAKKAAVVKAVKKVVVKKKAAPKKKK